MTFTGFGKGAIRFFEQLEVNNDRDWFRANKNTYDTMCHAPMEALLEEFGGDGKIFRIYRDVRFSKDKSPYKTYIAATFGGGYISMNAEAFSVATGAYMLDGDGLTRYRNAVADDASGKAVDKIATTLRKKGYELGGHEALKTAPKGFPKDHPRAWFLQQKGLHVWKGFPAGAWLSTRKPLEHVKTVMKDARPLNEWLETYVY